MNLFNRCVFDDQCEFGFARDDKLLVSHVSIYILPWQSDAYNRQN